MKSKVTAGTVARTIILVIALINQALVISGRSIINIADDDISQVVSLLFTIGAAILAWWKNNSFTANAIEADQYLSCLKNSDSDSNIYGGEE